MNLNWTQGCFALSKKETTYYWTVFISFINEGAYHSSFLISSSLLFPLDVATFIAQQMTRKGLTVPPLSLPGMELKVGWLHAINYPCSLTLLTLCSKQKKNCFFSYLFHSLFFSIHESQTITCTLSQQPKLWSNYCHDIV